MSDEALLLELRNRELQLLQRATRQDQRLVASMLTNDFRVFGTSGRVCTKDSVLAALQSEPPTNLEAKDFELKSISPDAALLTYISTKTLVDGDPARAFRSSVWVRREGDWQMLVHQGTRIP